MGRLLRNLVAMALAAAAMLGLWLALRRPPTPPPPVSATPRIVSLSPALSIILKDLGAAPLIVGRDKYDTVLNPAIPVCGDFQNVQYETILALRPTYIVMQSSEVPSRLTDLAGRNGWTIRNVPSLTVDDIESATRELAAAAGVSPDALLARMDQAWSRRGEGFPRAGRVLLIDSADPPTAMGPASFHQQLLERIGGTPAITQGKPYITMNAEDVLRLNPDVIMYFHPRPPGSSPRAAPPTAEEWRTMLGRLDSLDIRAVREGRLALIDDPSCLTPSSAMIGIADQMAGILARLSEP